MLKRFQIRSCVLRSRSDFVRVQSQGKAFRGSSLVLLVASGTNQTTRFGLTVSRKVGGAVTRNRVRRRLRNILGHHQHELCAGRDHVVIARPLAAKADFSVLREEVACLLAKANAWVLDSDCSSA